VLTEEALIVLAAIAACGLLALGVLELLWPTRPRHPVRRYPPPARMRPHRGRPPAAPALAAVGGDSRRALRVAAASPPRRSPARPAGSIVEHCLALHRSGRHAEVLEAAAGALERAAHGWRPLAPEQTASLWSVVALARQALGEPHGARTAVEAALDAAPGGQQSAYRRQLAALAERTARARLAEAERHSRPESEECLAEIREAAAWVERGLAVVPGDAALADLAAAAQAMLWPAWERTVLALAQRQDFRAARRLLGEALDDPRLPVAQAGIFRELFSGTFSGEIGQLTARAIRSVQEAREADALAALERAERLLGSLGEGALPPRRREEVDRRLWWGYRTLGERRVEAGACEAAVEPLFHALGYEVGPERQQETRALLVRALVGVADARALAVRELADAGDREGAVVRCGELRALLRSADDRGLTASELTGVHRRVQRLFESLGR
jgi:tetratricopeptide (TPR) repeat protein